MKTVRSLRRTWSFTSSQRLIQCVPVPLLLAVLWVTGLALSGSNAFAFGATSVQLSPGEVFDSQTEANFVNVAELPC